LYFASLAAGVAYILWLCSFGMLAGFYALFDHDVYFIIQDILLGTILGANLIGLHAASQRMPGWVLPLAPTIRWLAGASFTLYITHVPILFFIRAVAPWPLESSGYRATIVIAPILMAFVVAELGERRKNFWRGLYLSQLRRLKVS
jgi:peptidoglycan/LPS O-acetylase OafA/YrhL